MNAAVIATPTLDQIKQEIRAEAQRYQARAVHSDPESSEHDANDPPPPDFDLHEYSLDQLTNFHYRDFVEYAYRAVLKRVADPPGARSYLAKLASGGSKVAVLGSLRYSPEGRRVGVRVRGLAVRYAYELACRIPVLGYFVSIAGSVLFLPVFVSHQHQSDTYFAARWQATRLGLRRGEERAASLQRRDEELARADAVIEQGVLAQLAAFEERLTSVDRHLSDLDTRMIASGRHELSQLRHEVLAMKHWLTSIQSTVSHIEQSEIAERAELDALTADLSNRLANAPSSNRPEREPYLTLLRNAQVATPARPLLDVGSGRGEWLTLLQAGGFIASGVEKNRVLSEQCRAAGLDVAEGDLLEHLRRSSAGRFGVVSALQVIEYLPLPRLVAFLDEVRRTLQGDGLVLIESFDPGGADWSYRDPGCTEALAPEPLQFLLESRGFVDVQLLRPVETVSDGRPKPYAVVARNP